jgi:hypothetical protein
MTPVTSTESVNARACERPVGRAAETALDDAPHLRELVHQVLLVVEPPCRVDEHEVGAAGARGLDRVEGDRCGVGALLVSDHLDVDLLAPGLELLDRRRPIGVARGGEHLEALLLVEVRQAADGGRLAGAVDAHDQRKRRCLRPRLVVGAAPESAARRGGGSLEDGRELVPEQRAHLLGR